MFSVPALIARAAHDPRPASEFRARGRDNKPPGIGIWSAVLAQNEGGLGIAARERIHTGPPALDEAAMLERMAPYTDPVVLRAIHRLVCRYFETDRMAMPESELAQAVGVEESRLEEALAPLLRSETLQRRLSPDGVDTYELMSAERFLLLL